MNEICISFSGFSELRFDDLTIPNLGFGKPFPGQPILESSSIPRLGNVGMEKRYIKLHKAMVLL